MNYEAVKRFRRSWVHIAQWKKPKDTLKHMHTRINYLWKENYELTLLITVIISKVINIKLSPQYL